MKPYDNLPDGTILIHAEHEADLKRLFARAGIDILLIKTEEEFLKAHSAAGDALFKTILSGVESSDPISTKAAQHFTDGDL
jgi:hypothetical protein